MRVRNDFVYTFFRFNCVNYFFTVFTHQPNKTTTFSLSKFYSTKTNMYQLWQKITDYTMVLYCIILFIFDTFEYIIIWIQYSLRILTLNVGWVWKIKVLKIRVKKEITILYINLGYHLFMLGRIFGLYYGY